MSRESLIINRDSPAFKLGLCLGLLINKIFFNQKKEKTYSIRTDPIPLYEENKSASNNTVYLKKVLDYKKEETFNNSFNELLEDNYFQLIFQHEFYRHINSTTESSEVIIDTLFKILSTMELYSTHSDNLIIEMSNYKNTHDYNLYTEITKTQGYQSIFLKQLTDLMSGESESDNILEDIDRILKSMMQNSQWIKQTAEKINENKLTRLEINGYPEVKSLLNKISSKDKIC